MLKTNSPQAPAAQGCGRREFIALMAALMASNALAIDSMLPALPAIADALAVTEANRQQLVITAYLIGFGITQIVYGPLSDRFGRKGLLVGSLGLYGVFGLLAGLVNSFEALLAVRFMQGMAAAGTRVLVMAVIRDRYSGNTMAQIMSTIMIVFMVVPIIAPTFGQGVLAIASWRHIFIALGVYGAVLVAWTLLRLPETLAPENKRPVSVSSIASASTEALRLRAFTGNTIAQTLVMGALFTFINSLQQIVGDTFGRPELIGLVFALIAGPMTLSSYFNARFVERLGSRRLLLAALLAFTCISLLHLGYALTIGETLWSFVVLQAMTMMTFGLIGSNAGALAMEPVGRIAGTASSVQGVITTIGGALIGLGFGQAYDGTTIPLVLGFLICGALAFVAARWANPNSPRDRTERQEEPLPARV